MYSKRIHSKVKLPKAKVWASHPFRNFDNHNKLMEFLEDRLTEGRTYRDMRLARMINIDQKVSGWINLSDEELDDRRKNFNKGKEMPHEMNLPISFVHLDDMMTYFTQTFSPSRGMFYHMGKADESPAASQIVTIMNNHAIYANYYRQLIITIFGILKYNIGGFYVYWGTEYGPKFNGQELTSQPIWAGNRIEALDMYNTFWDPSVHPINVHKDGEYCARVEMVSHYWLQSQALDGIYFNLDAVLEEGHQSTSGKYYRSPPLEASIKSAAYENPHGADWLNILSANPVVSPVCGYEKTEIFVRLNPTEFGLVETGDQIKMRDRLEIWRFTIINGKHIVDATHMNNIHNRLPFFFGVNNDDQMGEAQRSTAEILAPLQDFASHLLNTHIKSSRRNIFGNTYYDSSVFDLSNIPPGSVNNRIPMVAAATGRDIRSAIYHDNTQLDTRQTIQDLGNVLEIVDKFFPTSAAPTQIGDIDRATTNQVAAVQQGSNRRNQKTARALDASMLRPLREALYYNIIQYQVDGQMISDFRGRPVQINLESLRATDMPFIIGQGLMMVDRQASASFLKEIIFALIQNPIAMQQLGVGMIGLINYWAGMLDVDIDLTQFMRPPNAQQQPDGTTPPGGEGLPENGSEIPS